MLGSRPLWFAAYFSIQLLVLAFFLSGLIKEVTESQTLSVVTTFNGDPGL